MAVFPAEVEQRLAFMNFCFQHFPDENGVIAGDVRSRNFTAQLEERAFENRDAAGSPAVVNGQALFCLCSLRAFGEVFGDGFVAFLEHADAELFFLFQYGENRRALLDANQNQQRVEGNGREGIGSHAAYRAGSALYGDDGDSRCEMAESLSKLMRSKRRRFHLWSF